MPGRDQRTGCDRMVHRFAQQSPQLGLVGACLLTNASDDERDKIPGSLLYQSLQVKEARDPEAGDKDDGCDHGRFIPVENESCGSRHFETVPNQDMRMKEGRE